MTVVLFLAINLEEPNLCVCKIIVPSLQICKLINVNPMYSPSR